MRGYHAVDQERRERHSFAGHRKASYHGNEIEKRYGFHNRLYFSARGSWMGERLSGNHGRRKMTLFSVEILYHPDTILAGFFPLV